MSKQDCTTDTDVLFAAYRESGDPEALASVFDETAPKLMLLAVQLTGDQFRSEDLVQATFLRLIEKAQRYDPERPFLPWASTILLNEARKAWRSDRRDPESDRLSRAVPDDPLRVAAEADTIEVLAAAIDDLGETYRAVVRLKVMHGMKPGEIARVLSISPQLARTRLSRGLDQLRAMLPAGIASSLVLLASGRGLANVRAAVLERAAGHASAAVPPDSLDAAPRDDAPRTSLGGDRGALRLATISLATAGVISVGCWVGWSALQEPESLTSEVVSPTGRSHDRALASRSADSRALATASDDSQRRAIPSQVPTLAALHETWTLAGEVRSADGAPLPDARVDVAVLHGCDLAQLPRILTGEDGRYEVDVDSLRALGDLGLIGASLLVDVSADGHWPAPVELLDELPGATAAPCALRYDVRLDPGRTVRADLLSPDGAPYLGPASVRMSTDRPETTPDWRYVEVGEEVLVPVDGAGPWRFEVSSAAGAVSRPVATLPPGGDLGSVALEVGSAVRGRFLVADGSPLAYANYSLWPVDEPITSEPIDYGRSDADGRFLSYGLEPGTYRLRLTYGAIEPLEAVVLTDAPPIDLHVDGQSLSLRLVDDQDRLVPGLAVLWEQHLADGVRRGHESINDVGGVFDFLVPFGSRWRFTSGTSEVAFEPLEHVARPDEPRAVRTIRVSRETRRGRVELQLVDAAGRAYGEFVADLSHVGTDELSHEFDAADLAATLPIGDYEGTLRPDFRVDGDHPSFLPREVAFAIHDGRTTRVELVVEPAGRLEVRVRGLDGPRLAGDASLEYEADGAWRPLCGLAQASGSRWNAPNVYDLGRPLRATRALAPGPLRVRLRAGDLLTHPVDCTIEAGARTDVAVEPRR